MALSQSIRCAFWALVLVQPVAAAGASSGTYYTEDQAARGARLYAVNCSRCHGVSLLGHSAPPLVGPHFRGRWPVRTLYRFVSRQMPADRRAGLSPDTYDSILAFLLQRNGHPAGAVALTAARTAAISAKL